jgi:glycosyltransferase involved in cell wall biosynthesis
MFEMLKKHPGVAVIHDVFLGGVIYWMTARKGKLEEFIDEVIYSHGEKGKSLVEKAKKNLIPWDHLIWNLPINKRIVDNATHVIVHSKWDKENITNLYPHLSEKISVIHQFAPIREFSRTDDKKTQLGFSKDDFLVCSFGFVVTTKKIDSIIKNIKKFLDVNPNAKYVIVGELDNNYGEIVKQAITNLNLSEKIIITGFIDETLYKKYLAACDVCISLREKTRAGTSASINHSLGIGIPTIISDVEPFNEFPNDVVLKIKPSDEQNLSKILDELYKNSDIRHMLGKKAKEFVEKNLSKDVCVEKYISILQKTLNPTSLIQTS